MKRAVASFVLIALVCSLQVGCESKAANGALIGGAAGAGIGAIIGHNSHGRTAGGALIGGAVGAVAGGLIGNEMDKQDRREERDRSRAYRDTRYESRSAAVAKSDVIRWSQQGEREEVIIDRIDRSGSVFRLSSRDENDLRDAGVSEGVIRAMGATARR